LPLHIFEMRYREMINRCIEENQQFGVILIDEGHEVGGFAKPHMVGTAARIVRAQREEDGRMNITAVGTQRFRIQELDDSGSYLRATVRPYPVVNGSTAQAADIAHKVRPHLLHYVELLSEASHQKLQLDRLPEDPTTLAFMVAIALQVNSAEKQKLLECAGIPDLLVREANLLARECLFTRHMIDTQDDVMRMNGGPTGCIFPN
jgi:Lon protease-like protein